MNRSLLPALPFLSFDVLFLVCVCVCVCVEREVCGVTTVDKGCVWTGAFHLSSSFDLLELRLRTVSFVSSQERSFFFQLSEQRRFGLVLI